MSGSELVERVEAAEVGSRELDSEIVIALSLAPEGSFRMYGVEHGTWGTGAHTTWVAPAYTTSLDAALALAERLCAGLRIDLSIHGRTTAELIDERGAFEGVANSPALALCAAILRANDAH